MNLLVINGPNLNKLGQREKAIYGSNTLKDLESTLHHFANEHAFTISCKQSNHEGEIIDWIHGADHYDGVILNAGAFTHYSYAIRDAIASIDVPVIEVHISNVYKREAFRHQSVLAPVTEGQITGFGFQSYTLACLALKKLVEEAEKWED